LLGSRKRQVDKKALHPENAEDEREKEMREKRAGRREREREREEEELIINAHKILKLREGLKRTVRQR